MVISTLFGTLLGFIASLIPEVLNILRQRSQNNFSVQQKQLDIEAATKSITLPQTHAQVSPDMQHFVCDEPRWVEVLRATVRPFVTYIFFALFLTIKLVSLYYGLGQTKIIELLPILWDAETNSLFAAVVSFWFGCRAISVVKGRQTNVTTGGEK